MSQKPSQPTLSGLLDEFVESLRPAQVRQLMRKLSPDQERVLKQLARLPEKRE